jgi:hypothetical protein
MGGASVSTGDPSRVDVSDVCVFRRSVRPTAIERGRFQRPDRANKRVSVKPNDDVDTSKEYKLIPIC